VQNHGKIAVKFYAKRAQTQRARIFCKIYDEISPPKARLGPPKTRKRGPKGKKSRRRKILTPKFRLQISPGKIALDRARFELAANFPS